MSPLFGYIAASGAAGGLVVFGSSVDGKVYALDIVDGSLIWRFTAEDALEASPALLDTVLYIGSLDGSLKLGIGILCLVANRMLDAYTFSAYLHSAKSSSVVTTVTRGVVDVVCVGRYCLV